MGTYIERKIDFVFELNESLKNIPKYKHYTFCSNKKCENHKQKFMPPKYCQECGSAIMGRKEEDGFKYPDIYDFWTNDLENKEVIASDNSAGYDEGLPENIWLYNYKTPEECFVGAEKKGSVMIFTNMDIESSIKKFKEIENVKLIIETFEKRYGKGMIQVKFMEYEAIY